MAQVGHCIQCLATFCLLHNATHWAWQLPPMLLHTVISTSAPYPCLVLLGEEGKRIKKLFLSQAFEVSYWSKSVCPKHALSQSLSCSQCLCAYLCTGNTSTIVGMWNAEGRIARGHSDQNHKPGRSLMWDSGDSGICFCEQLRRERERERGPGITSVPSLRPPFRVNMILGKTRS